jgi:acetolactate synthase I/II/III large subunit
VNKLSGAQLLVKCLETQGVEYVFGIPGAKIDRVFDALLDSKIKLIVCRHEQNAAFIAAAYGRLTGKPGIVLVTSGPGVANLTTGLLTATTEGDPVVAIGGNVTRAMGLKQSHQSMNNVELMKIVTKSSVEVGLVDVIPEVVANAFRIALTPQSGACFISVPQDVLSDMTTQKPVVTTMLPSYGQAFVGQLQQAAQLINQAKQPLLLLGLEASRPQNTDAIRALLKHKPFAVISTYQAAGVLSQELLDCFIGRVGLFKNQPGDQLLDVADVIVTIGFNSVEYDPEVWNEKNDKTVIHINYTPCNIHQTYHPVLEILGDIAINIQALYAYLDQRTFIHNNKLIADQRIKLFDMIDSGKLLNQAPIHPLRFIYELQQVMNDNTTVCCDIGTNYMWMARYFLSYKPHQVLFSNGQQTLGVGLPWAIATNYARPGDQVICISGDGGFLFSAMELETAVREKLKFIHFIWRDGAYNMVLEQEMMKYHRKSGVDFGAVNIVDFANAFGALGLELRDPAQFKDLFAQAVKANKPVLIDVPIDYSNNQELFSIIANEGH